MLSEKLTGALLWFAALLGIRDEVEQVARGDSAFIDNGVTGTMAPGLPNELSADTRGQLGFQTVLAALIVVIGVSLAVIVVDRFDQSLGEPSSSSLSTAQNDVMAGFADMAGLIGPLLLVGIAVVIISLLRRAQ